MKLTDIIEKNYEVMIESIAEESQNGKDVETGNLKLEISNFLFSLTSENNVPLRLHPPTNKKYLNKPVKFG